MAGGKKASYFSRGFELGSTEKQIQVSVRAELEPGIVGLRVQHADHLATLTQSRVNV